MVAHPFYQWLTDNVDRSQGGHSKMLDWVKFLGFRVGEDALSPGDLSTLHVVEEHWWRYSPRFGAHTWGSLFSEAGHLVRDLPNEQFFVTGPGRCSGYYKVTQELRDMITEAGWIYNVHPSTTYFEVIEGRLYAKYQQILGSRYICDIINYKEEQQ
jgi:hypothetical protein